MYLKIEKVDGGTIVVSDLDEAELVRTLKYEEYLRVPTLSCLTDFASSQDKVYEVWQEDDDALTSQFGLMPKTLHKRHVANLHSGYEAIHIEIVLPGYEETIHIPLDNELGLDTLPGGVTRSNKIGEVFAHIQRSLLLRTLDILDKDLRSKGATRHVLKGYKSGRKLVKFVQVKVRGEDRLYIFDTTATLHMGSGAVLLTWD